MPGKARRRKTRSIGEWKFDEPAEVALSLQAMQQVLPRERLGFREEALSRRELRFVLVGSNATAALAEREYPVLPFLTARNQQFWIGVQLKFVSPLGEAEFLSASLIVFHGHLTRESKEKLLRAEWERARDDSPHRHAQPHWHVYRSALDGMARVRRPSPGEGELEGQRQISLVDAMEPAEDSAPLWDEAEDMTAMNRFHLAMAAGWHLEGPAMHYEVPTPEGIGRWLLNCASYTRQQLAYMAEKLPRLPPGGGETGRRLQPA
jgi:hypothetical protein